MNNQFFDRVNSEITARAGRSEILRQIEDAGEFFAASHLAEMIETGAACPLGKEAQK